MQTVFLELVKLSLIGSLFAAAVMLVRLVFRKAPKWLFCVLWGVVALRLICPVSIESNISLVPDPLASGQILSNVGSEYIGDVDIIYESNAGYSNAVEAGRQPIYSGDGYYVVTEKDSLEAPKTIGQTVYPILSWIWVAGMLLLLTYTAVSYLLLRKKLEEATQLKDNIWQCEQVASPFVLGFIKPRIYLPYAISDSDMANVIAHEQAHIRRKDHWWKPIGFLLLSIHWFNPVLWLAYILLCRDIEAACDEKVIRHMDKDEMRAYSTALLNCSIHRRRIAACPLAFGETGVKERIMRVMHYKKPAFWVIVAAIIICAVVAVCFLTNPSTSLEFAMNGDNVHDLDVDTIIGRIQNVEGLEDGNAYINSNNFHLTVDSDFNWVDSQAVRYFFCEGEKTYSAQLRIFSNENKFVVMGSSEWVAQEPIFLLRHYLDAIKYLPQEAIRQMAPADRYFVRLVEEGTPQNGSRVITYTPNGTAEIEEWLIHLQLEPLYAAKGGYGYVGFGDDMIQLFYADSQDQDRDADKLSSLVSEIVNNPNCAASSNPFGYIEAQKELYNEIVSYGSSAVDCFIEQLRTGENGLQGYIMAVACADITGIGDKDEGADWGTAQEWLALYDKNTSGMVASSGYRSVPMVAFPKGTAIQEYLGAIHWLTIDPYGEAAVPFYTAKDGLVTYGMYTAYDAETFEPLKHIVPSGLSPQTYLFQNADPEREYIVLSDFGQGVIYAFGVRFGDENSALDALKKAFPEYFGLDAANGLDVYVWQMAKDQYSFGLLPHSEIQRNWISAELINLKGIPAGKMRMILDTYGIDQEDIHVIPWQNPISSYIGGYWIITEGEDMEQKRKDYVQSLRDMLFTQE